MAVLAAAGNHYGVLACQKSTMAVLTGVHLGGQINNHHKFRAMISESDIFAMPMMVRSLILKLSYLKTKEKQIMEP